MFSGNAYLLSYHCDNLMGINKSELLLITLGHEWTLYSILYASFHRTHLTQKMSVQQLEANLQIYIICHDRYICMYNYECLESFCREAIWHLDARCLKTIASQTSMMIKAAVECTPLCTYSNKLKRK